MVLPKTLRLKGYKCFDYLYKEGRRYYGPSMVIRTVNAKSKLLKHKSRTMPLSPFKVAVSISHKVSKKAVIRNQLRRLFHEYLSKKQIKKFSQTGIWVLISLKPKSSNESPENLLRECDKLLFKSGLL
tara:strand:- start:6436 stop:6819 length:384 start_codon:yes stop_codon:yes gene_type:complete